jgi:hypothetical protein
MGPERQGPLGVEPAGRAPDGPDFAVHVRVLRGGGEAAIIDGDVDPGSVAPPPHRLRHPRPAVRVDERARPTPVAGWCGGVAGHGDRDGAAAMSAPTGNVDTDYVIRRGRDLLSMAHIRRGAANAAEKVALLASEVAVDLDRYADQDDALALHALALAALARAYIALAAVLGEPYVIHGEPRNGAVL